MDVDGHGFFAQLGRDRGRDAKSDALGAKRRSRARVVLLLAASFFFAARPARAAEEGPLGAVIAFAQAGGMALGALPLFFLREDDAPMGMSIALGAGLPEKSFVMAIDVEGDLGEDGQWSWVSRSRTEFWTLSDDEPLQGAMRWDVLGGALVAGDPSGPAALEVIAGTSVWISADDRDESGRAEPYAAWGPSLGLRFTSTTPLVRTRVEASYVPLLGETPTGHLHHLDLTTEIGFSPWMSRGIPVVFEATLKREIGLGGDGDLHQGTMITGGIEISFDRSLVDPALTTEE